MKILDLVSGFFKDLVVPRRVEHVLPPTPVETQEIIRATLTRAVVAQIISGSDSTLLDKATFAVAPVIVDAVAQWGADQGARDWAKHGRPQANGTVNIAVRSELE
jgi:hypothetical protein